MDNVQDFLYGLALMEVGDTDIGFIEEDSFDLGGQAGEATEVKASQIPGAPVLLIPKSNGTIKPTFDLIHLIYENLVRVMGGKVIKTGEKATGWEAPNKLTQVSDKVVIYTFSGHKITIPKGTITAYLGDKLTLSGVAKIKTTITPLAVDTKTAPYKIENMTEDDFAKLEGQAASVAASVSAGEDLPVVGTDEPTPPEDE